MAYEEMTLNLKESCYSILSGKGYLEEKILQNGYMPEVAVITDKNVVTCSWWVSLKEKLQANSGKFMVLEVPPGETSKSIECFASLCSELAAKNFSRKTLIFAIGGGVVGDLAGFLAASYLRGVDLIQVPTTLLAMVDSSVGGKTGVNLPEGKNMVGAFYQPREVWIDVDVLFSLPQREMAAGMAEVIKYGVIRDRSLFDVVKNGRPEDLLSIIVRCVKIKAEIVQADERETSGQRALLNFGHTVGHAIEQSVGYGELLHGEAVAIGMLAAAFISQKHLGFSDVDLQELRQAIANNQLPLSKDGLNYQELRQAMSRDKKATADGLKWILSSRIGESAVYDDVSEALIQEAIESL